MGGHEALVVGVPLDEIDPEDHILNYKKSLQKMMSEMPIEPMKTKEVKASDAPSKEVVLKDDAIDILSFPFIQTNPADNGRFINTGNLITIDPDGGRNVGTYRMQIKGPRKIGISPERNQDGWKALMALKEKGEAHANVAVVLGTCLLYTSPSPRD